VQNPRQHPVKAGQGVPSHKTGENERMKKIIARQALELEVKCSFEKSGGKWGYLPCS